MALGSLLTVGVGNSVITGAVAAIAGQLNASHAPSPRNGTANSFGSFRISHAPEAALLRLRGAIALKPVGLGLGRSHSGDQPDQNITVL
jgi:hypothetical protein